MAAQNQNDKVVSNMKCPTAILSVAAFFALISPSANAAEVAACDLIQSAAASTLIREPVKQHNPNRQFQAIDGMKVSNCVFFGQRNTLKVVLGEYPNASAAAQAFSKATVNSDFATFSFERGLGEKAAWWKGGTEAYGYVVLQGNRVLQFDSRWGGANDGAGLKEQFKPVVAEAARKM